MVDIHADLESSDEGSGVASVVLTSITVESAGGKGHSRDTSEIVNGKDKDMGNRESKDNRSAGDGIYKMPSSAPMIPISGRAEKSERGQSRIYTVTYTVTDHAGIKRKGWGR